MAAVIETRIEPYVSARWICLCAEEPCWCRPEERSPGVGRWVIGTKEYRDLVRDRKKGAFKDEDLAALPLYLADVERRISLFAQALSLYMASTLQEAVEGGDRGK